MLDELRKIAIRFQIDPISSVGHSARLENVVKVLNDINKSYKNFLHIEFFKNEHFLQAYQKNNKLLETFIEELELLIVDVKFDSFAPAIAPNLIEEISPLFTNEVLIWKKEKFEDYKQNIFKGDFRNSDYIQKVVKNYSEEERSKIFQPLFSATGDGKQYHINILDVNFNLEKKFVQPEKGKLIYYIPKPDKTKGHPEYKTVQAFMKVKPDEEGKINLKKSTIKETFYLEELPYQTYPYKPNTIHFENKTFVLTEKLDCLVEYEEGLYILRNDFLDVTVWAETRDEVEEAFCFSFNALYQNYAICDDDHLTKESIELKTKLLSLIRQSYCDES